MLKNITIQFWIKCFKTERKTFSEVTQKSEIGFVSDPYASASFSGGLDTNIHYWRQSERFYYTLRVLLGNYSAASVTATQ